MHNPDMALSGEIPNIVVPNELSMD